ncbi:hypothetical protein OCJ37_08185 [Xanthomonas sp. AM6]|uniref:hypothetical protein n=1 Tax=Xanthomonas sp. AM6 TaxID=2982531 RepID=UPI0021D8259F|nr:hypothetical protein [Xanthomonas sp. AM6]UYB53902.1 hypothetical protein OCJ37_08185 [Xanthomonas sp. AM6]
MLLASGIAPLEAPLNAESALSLRGEQMVLARPSQLAAGGIDTYVLAASLPAALLAARGPARCQCMAAFMEATRRSRGRFSVAPDRGQHFQERLANGNAVNARPAGRSHLRCQRRFRRSVA